jgi:arylsulfatase K
MTQPNIIFFHAESWDGRMLGCMGQPALKNTTPNIDRIAQTGTLFENTYCSHPICCPSRANMWSGRYTHSCESWNNYKGLEPGMWALFDELQKTHTYHRLGKLDCMSGGHSQVARLSAWLGPSGVEKPVLDKDKSQCFSVADNSDIRCHEGDWQRVDQAIDFLKERKNEDRPFFLYVSTGLVHAAFQTNTYWLGRIPEDKVDIPPLDESEHPVRQHQLKAKAWRYGFDECTVRQVRRIYMAMCAEADAMVGTLYDAMHELGLGEDTYFVFSSDHGEMAMEHQDWFKMSLYEGATRVPLIVTGPGIERRQRVPNLVSLIDLCPTFLEMAGLPRRGGLDGESLLPLATGGTSDSRNSAYACFMGCTFNTSGYMLRKGRWKYIVYVGYPPQLFDIENDPQELIDLTKTRQEVVRELDAELRSIVDYDQCNRDWIAYCKEEFRQWRRQAKRGLHVDESYALEGNPSTDYREIMDNCFTGYDQGDEKIVEKWLSHE